VEPIAIATIVKPPLLQRRQTLYCPSESYSLSII